MVQWFRSWRLQCVVFLVISKNVALKQMAARSSCTEMEFPIVLPSSRSYVERNIASIAYESPVIWVSKLVNWEGQAEAGKARADERTESNCPTWFNLIKFDSETWKEKFSWIKINSELVIRKIMMYQSDITWNQWMKLALNQVNKIWFYQIKCIPNKIKLEKISSDPNQIQLHYQTYPWPMQMPI